MNAAITVRHCDEGANEHRFERRGFGWTGGRCANITLAVYAHALPSQGRSAAANLGALLASGGK